MHWISADKVSFYTVHGKIIKTSGLDHDINYLDCLDEKSKFPSGSLSSLDLAEI